jgi:protein TonB
LLIAFLISVLILGTAVITPFIQAKAFSYVEKRSEREVVIKLENLNTPDETVVPPSPPPPPAENIQQANYNPPVVVDSVMPDEVQLITAEQAVTEVKNEEAVEVIKEIKEEIQEVKTEQEPSYVVEEMPMFPGGNPEMQKFILDHIVYPDIARENNIQGKVVVKFCITPTGSVDKISVLKGVDPGLDAEAIRVIKILPSFKPGKQGGKPVPVWYIWPINFQLK